MRRLKVFIIAISILLAISIIYIYGFNPNTNEFLAIDLIPNQPMVKVFSYDGLNKWKVELIDAVSDNKIQVRNIRKDLSTLEIYSKTDNEVNLVYTDFFKVGLFAESYLNEESNIMTTYLKGPITKGTKWEYFDNVFEITDVSVKITTAAGTFNTVEITATSNRDKASSKMYFTKGIGVVKVVGREFSSELTTIDYETTFTGLYDVYEYVNEKINH